MSVVNKEWLKSTQKAGSYYNFVEKAVIGEKFFNAILAKRKNGRFYLNDDSEEQGFMASLYGIYELISIGDNFFGEGANFFKKIDVDVQMSLANEIKEIYDHIEKYGFDYSPIISNFTNEKFFHITENAGSKNIRQKYPYYGTMTWVLSLSSLLWKKYFAYTEDLEQSDAGKIESRKEIITDPEAVKIIRSLEDKIRGTIRHIIRIFASSYIKPENNPDGKSKGNPEAEIEEESKNKLENFADVDLKRYGQDNKNLKKLAQEEGLKLGWGYTKGVKVPSLYFTFSVLEAFSDFDSNILIGGDDDDYFIPDEKEIERGWESTKNNVYSRQTRLFTNLIDFINSDTVKDENGNVMKDENGKEIYKVTDKKYEKYFRKAAISCAYYLFYKFKDTIGDSFYNDDGYIVSKQQIMLSSSSPCAFYPLYILSSLLNGEVNGTIKTQLMYTRRARYLASLNDNADNKTKTLLAEYDKQIKALENEFKQFEGCFIDGLNNVQKLYSAMENLEKLDVIDRHYLTFDQAHSTEPMFSRLLSRENILAMPLLPLLVNVTNLFVLWITKFPDKQISAYVMDIFENYCNCSEDGNLLWVFEQGNYDLHATVRYVDAISNFYTYYDLYERLAATRAKDRLDARKQATEELKAQFEEQVDDAKRKFERQLKEEERKFNEQLEVERQEIKRLNKEIEDSDNKYIKVFNAENSVLVRLSEILNQYVECVHSGKVSPHTEAIDMLFKSFFRVAVFKFSADSSDSDKYKDELQKAMKYLFEKRAEEIDENSSMLGLFKNLVGQDYMFVDPSENRSDQTGGDQ